MGGLYGLPLRHGGKALKLLMLNAFVLFGRARLIPQPVEAG
jgi:hypothetical protein